MAEENSIFVGDKPFMNYVTGVVMQFTTKKASEACANAVFHAAFAHAP